MGLGLAAAKELASRGINLALVDYNAKSLEEARKEISNQYPSVKIITVVADVSKEEDVKNYVDETLKTFGRIDGLYNNAGIEGKQALITDYDVNIFKVASKHVLSGMTKNAALEYARYGITTNLMIANVKGAFQKFEATLVSDGDDFRKDWGLNWNTALETGGVLVSEEVKISGEVQFVKQA